MNTNASLRAGIAGDRLFTLIYAYGEDGPLLNESFGVALYLEFSRRLNQRKTYPPVGESETGIAGG